MPKFPPVLIGPVLEEKIRTLCNFYAQMRMQTYDVLAAEIQAELDELKAAAERNLPCPKCASKRWRLSTWEGADVRACSRCGTYYRKGLVVVPRHVVEDAWKEAKA